MNNKRNKLTWFLFLIFGFLILWINKSIKSKTFINLKNEFKELLKRNSKYTEDKDYILIHK